MNNSSFDSGTEIEFRQLEFYSPEFVNNLKAKYGCQRREREADCLLFGLFVIDILILHNTCFLLTEHLRQSGFYQICTFVIFSAISPIFKFLNSKSRLLRWANFVREICFDGYKFIADSENVKCFCYAMHPKQVK